MEAAILIFPVVAANGDALLFRLNVQREAFSITSRSAAVSIGRRIAVAGVSVPLGMELVSASGQHSETLDWLVLSNDPTPVVVRALQAGAAANLPAGTQLSLATPISGVSLVEVVDLRGGTEQETDAQLRARVPSVTRAWCAPLEMGPGTATLRFMCDALRADNNGFPTVEDVQIVTDYLDSKRPVAVKDFFCEAPIPEPIDFTLALRRDTP